ncbi:MAG: type III pantothenate kinase [Coriobacteriia bacterium]|nr:type III pantothenate kinase [Coriobacteriia bacterium]
MLLAVDIGNTQTAFAIFDADETLVYTGRIATIAAQTPDELQVLITSLFTIHAIALERIDQVVIASVVPSLTEHWVTLAEAFGADDILVVDAASCGGLDILLDVPQEAGADRLANAVGAQARYGTPAIVVDFGTATNIDVIDGNGAYLGGVISPGLETSAEALFSQAARLSAVDLVAPEATIGTSTRSAVQSGLLLGEAAKVQGLVEKVCAELKQRGETKKPAVIATGGLVELLAPLCECIEHIDTDLTLYGLQRIARLGQ